MEILFGIPSFRRPYVETLDYIPNCKVFIDSSDEESYRQGNTPADQLIVCPDGIQGNLCRVRNYMIDWAFDHNYDAIVILDDDISAFRLYKGDDSIKAFERVKIPTDLVEPFFEKYSFLCKELGFYFWGMNCNSDRRAYSQNNPFSFVSYIGGPVQVHLKGSEPRYDERLYLKEDYDMTLQHCNLYRGCLRLNFAFYECKQAKQRGGCAIQRTLDVEKEQFRLLQKKWGSKIVRQDFVQGRGKNRRTYDFNPVIKVPIRGL